MEKEQTLKPKYAASTPIILGIAAVCLLLGGAGWYYRSTVFVKADSNTQPPTDGSTVLMTENGFSPETLTVRAGTTVKFKNADTYWHWPASDPHPSHVFYPELDPHAPVKPGTIWSIALTKVGKWGIHDHLAPYETGTIIVTP